MGQRVKAKGIGPLPACCVCSKVLRFDNTSLYCKRHQYIRFNVGRRPEYPKCRVCGVELRIDNRSGLCMEHRVIEKRVAAKNQRIAIKIGPLKRQPKRGHMRLGERCRVPGCFRWRQEGNHPLCYEHLCEWMDSFQRRAAAEAALRWFESVADKSVPQVRLAPWQLENMANDLLGAGFDRLPSTDAMLRAIHIEDSPSLIRQTGTYSHTEER